jgi:hypothetical protein
VTGTPAATYTAANVVFSVNDAKNVVAKTTSTVSFSVVLLPYTFAPLISSNIQNYNLRLAAIAAGWDQVSPLSAFVTVDTGVVIGSSSTATPAFTVAGSYPAGSSINLTINTGANIVGAGGAGDSLIYFPGGGGGGTSGGTALAAAGVTGATITITNNGVIAGGGGGGGSGGVGTASEGAGGGGAGAIIGVGGKGLNSQTSGKNGTNTTGGAGGGGAGGAGGNLGVAGVASGSAPGAAGAATTGAANATWLATGTRLGPVQ